MDTITEYFLPDHKVIFNSEGNCWRQEKHRAGTAIEKIFLPKALLDSILIKLESDEIIEKQKMCSQNIIFALVDKHPTIFNGKNLTYNKNIPKRMEELKKRLATSTEPPPHPTAAP